MGTSEDADTSLQFLKFQAFAEQLTKETQDLKVKIENHKRENRRLAGLIDQQKDDNARLSVRLAGTEKQRDDALEALVLQQEIAEELERERKRNKKELAALQHTNTTLARQRDEARRVVLHLRSLIGGQSHHMEHLVESLTKPEDLAHEIEQGFEEEAGQTPEGMWPALVFPFPYPCSSARPLHLANPKPCVYRYGVSHPQAGTR